MYGFKKTQFLLGFFFKYTFYQGASLKFYLLLNFDQKYLLYFFKLQFDNHIKSLVFPYCLGMGKV